MPNILTALINSVYTETNRPDLIAETTQAVLEATLSIHCVDEFYKDIMEVPITFTNSTYYIQSLAVSSLPNYRDIAYIRKIPPSLSTYELTGNPLPVDSTTLPTSSDMLRRIDIGDIFDSYGYEKRDVWYQAGATINMKSSTPLQYITVGYYAYPILDSTGLNFSSWIASELPYVIVYKAAGSIFSKIGEDKSWAIYMKPPIPEKGYESGGLYYQQLGLLVKNNIRAGV